MRNSFFYILMLLELAFMGLVRAQEVKDPLGLVHITPIEVWEKDDSLYLKMDIELVSKTMNDCQSWQIIPELVNKEEGKSRLFPYVLINGKTKEKLYGRRIHFKDTVLLTNPPYIKAAADILYGDVLTYTYSYPYESWMDSASLKISQILTSCADNEQWFVLEGLGKVKTEEYIPYSASPIVNYIEPERIAKLRQMEGEAFLDFQAGRSEIVPSYRRNPTELARIDTSISEVVSDTDVEITELLIEGYASPDGSYTLNERLSRERATALKNYLQRRYKLSNNQLKVESTAEDWDGLRVLVEESFLNDKERILEVINSEENPDRKEQRLKTLPSWRVLLSDYFPRLRRVKYKVDYKVRDFSIEEAGELLQRNPGHLNQSELFTLAESFGIDSPRWHEIMQLTVLLYPHDPVAHINMAASALTQKNPDLALQHLEKVGDDPRAYNNLAVYYLYRGDTENAERYLSEVKDLESLPHNQEELEKIKEDYRRQQIRARRGIEIENN